MILICDNKILIVNDNTKLANAICQVLNQHGYNNVEVLSEYDAQYHNFFQSKMLGDEITMSNKVNITVTGDNSEQVSYLLYTLLIHGGLPQTTLSGVESNAPIRGAAFELLLNQLIANCAYIEIVNGASATPQLPATMILTDEITMHTSLNDQGCAVLTITMYDDDGDYIEMVDTPYDANQAATLVSLLKNGATSVVTPIKDQHGTLIGTAGADISPYAAITIINTFTKLFNL